MHSAPRYLLPVALAAACASLACGEEAFSSASPSSAGSGAGAASPSAGKDSGPARGGATSSNAGEPGEGGVPAEAGKSSVIAEAGASGDPVVEVPDIPTQGLELWFRADAGVTESGGAVAGWKDGTEHARDALQLELASRPKLVEGALSGKAALVFDGIDDYLELPALDADMSSGVSMFIAFQQDSIGSCGAWFEASNGRETQELHFGDWQKSVIYEIAESYLSDSQHPLMLGKPQVVTAVHQPTQMVNVRSNSSMVVEGKVVLSPANLTRQKVYIARTLYTDCNYFKGRIGELMLYSRPVTSQELVEIEGYLQSKWGCCTQ